MIKMKTKNKRFAALSLGIYFFLTVCVFVGGYITEDENIWYVFAALNAYSVFVISVTIAVNKLSQWVERGE